MDTPNHFDHRIKARTGRIAKLIARAGVCSRREAERLIADARVSLNGKIVETPAVNVAETDVICVDGKPISLPQTARLWRYHKRKGEVTTRRDPQGRLTVFDRLPEDLPRLISVGRLDYNTEGLLLFTNDGALSRHLELPSTGWTRRYRVRVHGVPRPEALAALAKGIEIEGVRYGPVDARLERQQGSNAWLSIAIREGKNREVRRIMQHMGLSVTRLIRVSFGPFQLGELEPGQIEEVKPRQLAAQLGPKLAAEFGLQPLSSAKLKPKALDQREGKPKAPDNKKGKSRAAAKPVRPAAGHRRASQNKSAGAAAAAKRKRSGQ